MTGKSLCWLRFASVATTITTSFKIKPRTIAPCEPCLASVSGMKTRVSVRRRIRDTLCQLQPATIAEINHAIVSHGQELHGEAAESVRADSFVVETNIHYPTESSLIGDGMRKIIPLCVRLGGGDRRARLATEQAFAQASQRACPNDCADQRQQEPEGASGLPSAYGRCSTERR